ncbi:MAG: HAD-IC family P-type ATPase, partial [Chloroflexi bacterium]|nr:HAD-IC family P-type ATPase [Chloroflexota bacterium]
SDLRQQGIKHIAIVSGDHKQPTQKLAQSLGIDSYFYDILPQDKASIVEQLQKEGKSVCFVGDGINDAIAMQKADVSISFAGASSIASDIAQVILLNGTLFHIAELFEMSKYLEINLRNSFILTTAPTIVNIGGAFLVNFGFTTAIIVKYVGFLFGLGNAMLPLRKLENDHFLS